MKRKHLKHTTMRYYEITTVDQDVDDIDAVPYNLDIADFIAENPTFYIDYGEGGTPQNAYPNLCETTEDEENVEATFSVDGTVLSKLIAGTHPVMRPK